MNVEINFLEKQEKKKIAPFMFSLLAILLFGLAIGVTWYQTYLLTNELSDNNIYLEKLEAVISENQDNIADQQRINQLQQAINNLQQSNIPTVDLYREIIGLLNSSNQLQYYEHIDSSQLVVDVVFPNLTAATSYVSNLLDLKFVQDVQLNGVSKVDSGYQATLTVLFDEVELKQELNPYE
jgi:pilus assembly protein HofN